MNKIGVFLSSNSAVSPLYAEAARQLGQWIGRQGKTLVYGGNASGLMEQLAQAVHHEGGHVVGVLPQAAREGHMQPSEAMNEAICCPHMAARKQTILEQSDILVALPGGIGTLDELFTVVASATVGEHQKQVVLYNVDHCWDSLLQMLDDLRRQQLIYRPTEPFLKVAHTFKELTQFLR